MTCRILVVDDEMDVETLFRQGLRKELRKGELEMEFVLSAMDALDLVRRTVGDEFDMVISDLNMPGMNGLELVQVIRQEYPDMRLAVATAYADPVTQKKAEAVGAEYFFPKPVDFAHIRSCLAPHQA